MSLKNFITRPSAVLLGVIAIGSAAGAAPIDVPASHWASKSVASVMSKKIMTTGVKGKFDGDKPVTRYELAATLDRFVRYIEQGRKPLHPSPRTAEVTPPAKATAEQKAAIVRLAAGNFLPANSPLYKNEGDKIVTAQEFKDSLSAVVIRLSDRAVAPQKN